MAAWAWRSVGRTHHFGNPEKKEYPLPLYVAEKYNCEVGRLRLDYALDNGLCFWVAGDQLLKGAVLNAAQIAEVLLK